MTPKVNDLLTLIFTLLAFSDCIVTGSIVFHNVSGEILKIRLTNYEKWRIIGSDRAFLGGPGMEAAYYAYIRESEGVQYSLYPIIQNHISSDYDAAPYARRVTRTTVKPFIIRAWTGISRNRFSIPACQILLDFIEVHVLM